MGSLDNLIPLDTSSEKQRERGRKSGEARRRKRTLRQTLEVLMEVKIDPKDAEELCAIADEKGLSADYQTIMMLAQAQKALGGNTAAAQFVRDTIGEKPSDKVDVSYTPVVIGGEEEIPD